MKDGSPRFFDACKRQGIEPSEFKALSLEEFKKTVTTKDLDEGLLEILWEHDRDLREEKRKLVSEVCGVENA